MLRPTISLRSWPEEKTLPAAARITARSERSRAIWLRHAMSSVISSSESALRRCGRLRVTIAIGPSVSNEMLWYGIELGSFGGGAHLRPQHVLANFSGGSLGQRTEVDRLGTF